MTYENPRFADTARLTELNASYRHTDTIDMLRDLVQMPHTGPLALVSSFGAESVVLLHMVSKIKPDLPILFIDTEMLFPQTLAYQRMIAEKLGLTDIRRITPARAALVQRDADNLLHLAEPNACCALRKVEPLARGLLPFGAWISGRKRFHGGTRTALEIFELDELHRLKVNPLAYWTAEDINDYMTAYDLPKHPLVEKGYPSIGCAPCTTPARAGQTAREGRWRGQEKTECGIHFPTPDAKAAPVPVIVDDNGFSDDDWQFGFQQVEELDGHSEKQNTGVAIDLPNSFDLSKLDDRLGQIDMLRIDFPVFSDGRGFSLAQQLRQAGFVGRLRAKGPLIPDQYAMLRRSGFDEVEISPERAKQQTEKPWRARANWQAHDYQRRFQQSPEIS